MSIPESQKILKQNLNVTLDIDKEMPYKNDIQIQRFHENVIMCSI